MYHYSKEGLTEEVTTTMLECMYDLRSIKNHIVFAGRSWQQTEEEDQRPNRINLELTLEPITCRITVQWIIAQAQGSCWVL